MAIRLDIDHTDQVIEIKTMAPTLYSTVEVVTTNPSTPQLEHLHNNDDSLSSLESLLILASMDFLVWVEMVKAQSFISITLSQPLVAMDHWNCLLECSRHQEIYNSHFRLDLAKVMGTGMGIITITSNRF